MSTPFNSSLRYKKKPVSHLPPHLLTTISLFTTSISSPAHLFAPFHCQAPALSVEGQVDGKFPPSLMGNYTVEQQSLLLRQNLRGRNAESSQLGEEMLGSSRGNQSDRLELNIPHRKRESSSLNSVACFPHLLHQPAHWRGRQSNEILPLCSSLVIRKWCRQCFETLKMTVFFFIF